MSECRASGIHRQRSLTASLSTPNWCDHCKVWFNDTEYQGVHLLTPSADAHELQGILNLLVQHNVLNYQMHFSRTCPKVMHHPSWNPACDCGAEALYKRIRELTKPL